MSRQPHPARLATAAVAAAAVAVPLWLPSAQAAPTAPATASLAAAPRYLEANLRGTAAGDPDGSGHASFTFYPKRGRICATVEWHRIAKPNAAHIHRGKRGVDGPVVVDLTGSVTGGAKCATGVRLRLIRRILAHPRWYYYNVHNVPYPGGAIRGQLHWVR